MDKVVILARVSTDKQEYRRQVNELKSFCQKMDWEIIGTFTNKISGAESLENRKELIEMIEFVRSNDVQRVVCLEISRLGRNTLEALKVIQILNENKVSLYIKNYSLETLNSDRSIKLRVAYALYPWRLHLWNVLLSESAGLVVEHNILSSVAEKA